jgi:multiple sugar transport system permease protein
VFRHIKLPLLLPSIAVALIFQTIFKLRVFGLVFTLTGGGPGKATTPLGIMIQRTYFRYFEGGYSAAIAVVLFLIGGFFSILYIKMVYREVEY